MKTLKKIGEWLKNIGKFIEGALTGKQPEPVPVPVPVRR
jgi:hypothetical protein